MTLDQLEQQYPLGNPLSTYRYPLLKNPFISLTLAVGGIGIVFLSFILLVIINSPQSVDHSQLPPYYILFGLCILVGLVGAYEAITRRHDRQILYDHGFINVKRNQCRAILYRDIQNIYQTKRDIYYDKNIAAPLAVFMVSGMLSGGPSANTMQSSLKGGKILYTYQFELETGERIVSLFDEVGDHVKSQIFPDKLQQLTQAYQQGDTIPFGPLGVSTMGITYNNKTLPWSELQTVTLDQKTVSNGSTKVHIKRHTNSVLSYIRSHWASVELKQIPNFDVFLSLVQQLQETAGVLVSPVTGVKREQ